MSVADFDQTLQNRIFNTIRSSKDRKAYITGLDTQKLRKKYEAGSAGASSVFTESGLDKLKVSFIKDIKNLSNLSNAEAIVSSINYKDFVNFATQTFSSRKGSIVENAGVLKLSDVPQDTLRNIFLDYVETIVATSNIPNQTEVLDYISENIQSGHLAGVFSLKLKQVLNLDITSTGPNYRDIAVTNDINEVTKNSLEMVLKAVLDADYVTSSIYDKEEIFVNATKAVLGDNPHLEIELQFAKDNKAAGDLLTQAGRNLNKLLDRVSGNSAKQLGQYTDRQGTVDSFTDLIKSLKPLAEMLLVRAKELQTIDKNNEKVYLSILTNAANLDNLANALINTKGSPSLKESIGQNIASLIETGTVLKPIVTRVTKKSPLSSKKDNVSTENSNILKKVASAIKQAANKVSKTNKIKIQTQVLNSNLVSLVSLQNLINQHLQSVISANMGDGSSRNILNYRTGRFAASATVERMSQSRAGMITAFYNYMRNPYQTFEPGYRQGSPKSRDPKLLISQSIREIAATRVGNRLRAVLV